MEKGLTKEHSLLVEALEELREAKPNDRSDKDRRYAILITELEKLIAYYYVYVYKTN